MNERRNGSHSRGTSVSGGRDPFPHMGKRRGFDHSARNIVS